MVGPWIWIVFGVAIMAMLALDMAVHAREPGLPSFRSSVLWSIGWTVVALLFTLIVLAWQGSARASEYIAGYVIERSLSLDNLFVFSLLFSFFAVPVQAQRKVLFFGIIGAVVLRLVFILAGGALLDAFHFTIYVFGAFLIVTGVRMATHGETKIDPDRNPLLRLVRRAIPMTEGYHGNRIFLREGGRRMATPLLAALLMVATFDVVFAIDSIPAVFAITRETFIVFAANAFSLLGLTSLFFLVAGLLERFHLLSYGLAAILVFVGIKMLIADLWEVPVGVSLAVIVGILVAAAWASRAFPKGGSPPGKPDAAPAA